MDTLRLLHTSDVHIGAPFEFLGPKGNAQRLALRDALVRIARIAREGRYDALLIAGDLFDSAYGSSEADVSFVIQLLHDAGTHGHVVILPGGHDHYAPGSVYERELKRFEAPGTVHILTPKRRVVEIPELSLAVHGRALESNVAAESVLAGLTPVAPERWNVCVAHCSVAGFAVEPTGGEAPARLEDLEPGFDYVALGHWHSHRVLRTGPSPVVYSGSPEVVARDQAGAGSVVSITLSAEGAAFETVSVGTRRIERHSVECTGARSTEELVKRILDAVPADPNLILELSLGGLIGIESALDPGQIPAELDRRYFSARLAGKGPAREISRDELLAVPEDTVAGAFVRRMLAKIDGSEGETKALYEEALQLGYQLFRGRDLIA